ncbi:MAG: hypothetical protein KGY66_00560 [Candidatus Thermoplasmatota archaeon]|nr:hypothetical protein [Candidatus Thermoplasmatota archaeon]MBS3789395.1 hypothetical protein [Candidatus Thermoplasmatota archaeon]
MSSFSSYQFNKNRSKIYLFGIVKGLVSEAERLEKEIKKLTFDVGGLPISKEEKKGLKEFMERKDIETDVEPSTPEKIYAEKLKRFGQVTLPPPSYTFFMNHCLENEIEIEALDMDEEHYTMAYCEHVTGLQWIGQALREKGLGRKKIEANDPVEFANKWDRVINKLKGFQELEARREKVMAKNIDRLSERGDMVVLVEEERIKGVRKHLKKL